MAKQVKLRRRKIKPSNEICHNRFSFCSSIVSLFGFNALTGAGFNQNPKHNYLSFNALILTAGTMFGYVDG